MVDRDQVPRRSPLGVEVAGVVCFASSDVLPDVSHTCTFRTYGKQTYCTCIHTSIRQSGCQAQLHPPRSLWGSPHAPLSFNCLCSHPRLAQLHPPRSLWGSTHAPLSFACLGSHPRSAQLHPRRSLWRSSHAPLSSTCLCSHPRSAQLRPRRSLWRSPHAPLSFTCLGSHPRVRPSFTHDEASWNRHMRLGASIASARIREFGSASPTTKPLAIVTCASELHLPRFACARSAQLHCSDKPHKSCQRI